MQLDCELVDLDFGDLARGKDTLHLEDDHLTEGLTTGAAEGEAHLVLLVVVGDHVRSHRERHLELGGGFAFDFLVDGKVEHLNWELHIGLLIGEGQGATSLPWPVGVVEDLKFDDLGHTRGNRDNTLRFLLQDGASFLPWLLALEVPLLTALLHLLLDVLDVEVSVAVAHLGHELLDHLLEHGRAATATSTTTVTSTSAATTTFLVAAAKGVHHLVDEVLRVFGLLFLGSGVLLVEHGNHDIGSSTVLRDLEEGVLVTETLLTLGAVVKVLADTALVAQALDRVDTAAVTANILVDNLSLLS